MKNKILVVLIILFVITGWGNTFYQQHKANELLAEIASTPIKDVKAIMLRNPKIGQWVPMTDIPEKVVASLFSALARSEPAIGMRSVTPNTNVVIRIKTEMGYFDFDFLFHKQDGEWINFTLVNRNYFGIDSFTQEHYGDFKSKDLSDFLQYVENKS